MDTPRDVRSAWFDEYRALVDEHCPLALKNGSQKTESLLLHGRTISEPVAKRGPCVMNPQQEIRQGYSDYQQTQFGG